MPASTAKPTRPQPLDDAALYRRLGMTPTPGRLLILRYLTGRSHPISAQQLGHDPLMARTPVGLHAIYGALHQLADTGELHTFTTNGETTYRRCSPAPHHHLICTGCGQVWEEDPGPVRAWVDDYQAHILVLCAGCQAGSEVQGNNREVPKRSLEDPA